MARPGCSGFRLWKCEIPQAASSSRSLAPGVGVQSWLKKVYLQRRPGPPIMGAMRRIACQRPWWLKQVPCPGHHPDACGIGQPPLRVLQALHGDLEEMELGVSELDPAMAQGG